VSALDAAVEEVYAAFHRRGLPRLYGCPCCTDPNHLQQLTSVSLRDVDPELLQIYAFKAITTVGTEGDYSYFLPRILELHATQWKWMIDLEVTGKKIAAAGASSWPARQQEAIVTYWLALVDDLRHNAIDEVLCAVGRSGIGLSEVLDLLDERPDLIEELEMNSANTILRKGRLANAFWDAGSAAHAQVLAWLTQYSDLKKL